MSERRSRRSPRNTGRTTRRASEEDEVEDEEEEEETPRRRKSRSEKTRKSRNADSYRDDDDDEEEEEEEKPRKRGKSSSRGKSKGDNAPIIATGWGGYAAKREAQSEYLVDFKTNAEPQLIRFLEDQPVAVYYEHWIERKGKKSFTCLGEDNECPLCELGDKPRTKAVFNILRLVDEDNEQDFKVMPLIASPRLADKIRAANDGRNGPIDSGYWVISHTGDGTSRQFDLLPVKERDLEDDWDLKPLEDEDIEDYMDDCFSTEEVVERISRTTLEEIAEEVLEY